MKVKLDNGLLLPKPYQTTPAEIAEALQLGVTEDAYRSALGGNASHEAVIAFLKDHASLAGLDWHLYNWGVTLQLGATVAQLRDHRELQEDAGLPVDYERHHLAMTAHVPFGAQEFDVEGHCVPSVCGL